MNPDWSSNLLGTGPNRLFNSWVLKGQMWADVVDVTRQGATLGFTQSGATNAVRSLQDQTQDGLHIISHRTDSSSSSFTAQTLPVLPDPAPDSSHQEVSFFPKNQVKTIINNVG